VTGDLAIALAGAGKRYTKYEDAPALVNTGLRLLRGNRRSQLWALRDIDLDVAPGECVGVIGRNGSGKSTLLQLLCGVTAPTEGRVRVVGRVAPLISVGVGFHPELTGRENIYVNAAILGLTRAEVDRKVDEIVDFAEIADFIDTPVKFYSSGMFVRLGFSVAIQVRPDVLLVDEVLAVGDFAFQMKCFERMRAIRAEGVTIVFVTHNLTIVRNLCDRVVVLDRGHKAFDGQPDAGVSRFHELLADSREPEGSDIGWAVHKGGIATVTVEGLYDDAGVRTQSLAADQDITARISATALARTENAYVGVAVHAADGTLVYSEPDLDHTLPTIDAGFSVPIQVRLRPTLPTGTYTFTAGLYQRPTGPAKAIQLAVAPTVSFHVIGRPMVQGNADLQARFTVLD
jgi:ABC-type polysaccharide/polyol phosphate transport system ATPase subunit